MDKSLLYHIFSLLTNTGTMLEEIKRLHRQFKDYKLLEVLKIALMDVLIL
jgi:hypothetical protein